MIALLTPAVRRWLYGVAAAALAVAAVYGVIDGNQLAAWLVLAAALFGVAIANVHPDEADEADEEPTPPPRHAAP